MKSVITMRYPSSWHGEMWREGAPCGNGIVGALVYGGAENEYIMLNHTKLWKGGNIDEIPDVSASVAEVRRLLDENRPDLADSILPNALLKAGYRPGNSDPLPLGDIRITRHSETPFTGYRRRIDLEKAEVRVSWNEGNTQFCRSTFVSRDDGLCYTKISCTEEGKINITVTLDVHDRETIFDGAVTGTETFVRGDTIYYAGDNKSAYESAVGSYGIVMRVICSGGVSEIQGRSIRITDADEVLLVSAVFAGENRAEAFADTDRILENIPNYKDALEKHAKKHMELYGGVDFSISDTERSNEELLLEAFDESASNELMETMYAYGRYLLVCSTASPETKDVLPTHLVGLWNGTYRCFWAFHMFNVNFEMIYWQALSGNMPSLLRTALDYVENFMDDFRENAKKIFGCRGIYIDSVNTPESGRAACLASHIINWTAGAAWVAQHFWDYWRYTGDEDYLKKHAMPFMYETALFYEDFLVLKNGRYEFAPSTSPENVALNVGRDLHSGAQTSKNASMDIACAREVLTNLLTGSAITGMYADKREKWTEMLSLLPEYKYNEDGSLKEWADDFYEDNNRHRHHSHLYGVFPGCSVKKGTKEYEGMRLAEKKRLAEGLTSQSSWSMIYAACVNARLGQGEDAWFALSEMTRYCCMNNLFTVHNDWRRMGSVNCSDMRTAPFQIDANIGFSAAVNEMLLGCADSDITLLPALPEKWKNGRISGLSAPGGRIVSIRWQDGCAEAVFSSKTDDAVHVKAGDGWTFEDGKTETVITGAAVLRIKKS